MPIVSLTLSSFRNLSPSRLDLLPAGFNFFYGKNGSGKTSLIECLYYLIHGRSFRSTRPAQIIQYAADQMTISAKISKNLQENAGSLTLGLARWRDGRIQVRADGEELGSFSSIARRFPVLLAHSGSYQLLDAGPAFRRRYLDWGAFYLRDEFLALWKRYSHALRQRNSLLRARRPDSELYPWSVELAEWGVALHAARTKFVDELLPFLTVLLPVLLPLSGLKMTYLPGWPEDTLYPDALQQSLDRDRCTGCTQNGPHRADFSITVNGMALHHCLSRGQQKLFVYAMLLAQGALIQAQPGHSPVYLFDDLPAELDSDSLMRLLGLLDAQKVQVFFTGIHPEGAEQVGPGKLRMFHVEHGMISVMES